MNLFELYRANQDIIGVNSVALPFVENAKLLNELKSGFENGILSIIPLSQSNIFSWSQATKAYVNVLQGVKGSTLLQFSSDEI